jgi:hypothetical protein
LPAARPRRRCGDRRDTTLILLGLATAKVAVHHGDAGRYGFHRDGGCIAPAPAGTWPSATRTSHQ